MLKVFKNVSKKLKDAKRRFPENLGEVIVINTIIVIGSFLYLKTRFQYINDMVPLWYTKPWGNTQLAEKSLLFIMPGLMLSLLIIGVWLSIITKKRLFRFSEILIYYVITLANILLTFSLVRIIFKASTTFNPLIEPLYLEMLVPFVFSLGLAYFITPRFIKFAKSRDLVTDPAVHKHPGMLLKQPAVRGGGIVFSIAFLITVIIFIPISKEVVGVLTTVMLTAIIGLMDDYANTNPNYKLKFAGNPLIRLFILLPIAVLPILMSGVQTDIIGNPFNGALILNSFKLQAGSLTIAPVAILFTFLWILWVMNMLSWSNGIDGQYSGIVGIAAIVIAILALRLINIEPEQEQAAKIAAVLAGASLGILPYNWHPSKILWGFGAMSAGAVIASLSIITRAKIATSIIVLLIPFLDGSFTVLRRILQKKAPYKGDKGHLHHLLLRRGWSVKKTAIFYWISTAILGVIGIVSAEKDTPLVILTLGGIVAFFILSVNMSPLSKEKK
ncbi:MAG: glycosyltransferase family 4 protein [Patescibacteria group bacterium]